jgi:tryptophan-rich sensory protein
MDEWYAARVLYAAMGWGSGVFFIAFGLDIKLRRYIWLGLIGGLASTLLLFFPLQFGEAGLAFGAVWGTILLASGMVVLLRAWKKSQDASHDG